MEVDKSLFYHLALPPQLPQREDPDPRVINIEEILVARLVAAVRAVEAAPRHNHIQGVTCDATNPQSLNLVTAWESIRKCLTVSRMVNSGGRVNKTRLLPEIRGVTQTPNNVLILYIRAQNAGLIIHRQSKISDHVIVEVFEASPKNEEVLAAGNALQWDFPGSAVAIPLATFNKDSFQSALVTFLEQASLESTKEFSAVSYKAQTHTHESRDTASPTMISSLLMAILEENGTKISTPLLRKRIRDDVCWNNASNPWRRLPYWLVLRVGIERYLCLKLGAEHGRFEYKFLLSILFANFLDTSQEFLTVEELEHFKAKLCRRLVKLDVDRRKVDNQDVRKRVDELFDHCSLRVECVVKTIGLHVQSQWEDFKGTVATQIHPLPKTAPEKDLDLPLRNSLEVLKRIQNETRTMLRRPRQRWERPPDVDLSSITNKQLRRFARPIFQVVDVEFALRDFGSASIPELSLQIHRYVGMALPVYQGNPEQMSTLILNAMELWVKLDERVCDEFPLLGEYHPVFTPESLDPLRLASFHDMVRLQVIQDYLHHRISDAGSKATIFDDPSPTCFATRYYDRGRDAMEIQALRHSIMAEASRRKDEKFQEWEKKRIEFEQLTQQVEGSACIFTVDRYDNKPVHDEHYCSRCRAMKRIDTIKIQIYEEPLPSEEFMIKAAVFELACPDTFAKYRDTTWMVMSSLASWMSSDAASARCVLRRPQKGFEPPVYSQLLQFSRTKPVNITLGSLTKSFLTTHYSVVRFPVKWEGGKDGVCKPNGLKLAYYDSITGMWTGRSRIRPSFMHHLQLTLPKTSPFQSIFLEKWYSADSTGPSSYEIAATQLSCPPGLNVHEFLAFKTLLSGYARRWISILVELGSTNLNWSSEATMMLLNYITLQCGPASDEGDSLRLVHSVFRNVDFFTKLLEQVSSRLNNLAALTSWRETQLMAIIITLSLRMVEFGYAAKLESSLQRRAIECIVHARNICVSWFRLLKAEIHNAQDMSTAQQLQQRALSAALLCRRTFFVHPEQKSSLDPSSLEAYVESGIVIQENMASEIESLPENLLQELVFVLKLSRQLEPLISSSIKTNQEGLRNAFIRFWPEADQMEIDSSTVSFEKDGWLRCDINGAGGDSCQIVHFNLYIGTFLVNGKPVGKLPQDSQNSLMIKELFGDQPLRVYQSPIVGMTYVLTLHPHGYTVHVGYNLKEEIILVRGKKSNSYLRLIPRGCFVSGNQWDLPGPLVDGNFHWLNVDSGELYITPVKNPWAISWRNWTVNIHQQHCKRRRSHTLSESIIDPMSLLFRRAAKILDGLTHSRYLYVTQPSVISKQISKGLEVQIPIMQLMFFVNYNQYLFSPQLGLEVDPDQDAGTWYGLRQKLVCRRVDNPIRRTVLVPLGKDIVVDRLQCHVSVTIPPNPDGKYGKFDINNTLGRIDCAAEPRLIYTKALLHAFTSFQVPDPLTGRTGLEEALQWLRSGVCHPWTVLGPETSILERIAALTPPREYYPADQKMMKTDHWDRTLTTHMQHPLYRPFVDSILSVSRELENFSPEAPRQQKAEPTKPLGDLWLNQRALQRRQLYERECAPSSDDTIRQRDDRVYPARDRPLLTDRLYTRVLEITHLIRTRPMSFQTPHNLATILSQGNVIGGYETCYNKVSLSDRMQTDIREHWGSLVQYCRHSRSQYELMFLFANLSIRETVDDCLLKSLAAFAIFEDLQALSLPPWTSYFNFRRDSSPNLDDLVRLILPSKVQAPKHDFEAFGAMIGGKQHRKLQAEKDAHERRSEKDCCLVANFFLDQWPCQKPNLSKLEHHNLLVDADAALEAIQGEWLRLYQNMELSSHLKQVQTILDRHRSTTENIPRTMAVCSEILMPTRQRHCEVPSLALDLLTKSLSFKFTEARLEDWGAEWVPLASIPKDQRGPTIRNNTWRAIQSNAKPQISRHEAMKYIDELEEIVKALGKTKSLVRKTYSQDLLKSLQTFRDLKTPQQLARPFLNLRILDNSQANLLRSFALLKTSLDSETPEMSSQQIKWLRLGGLWPVVTTVSLLEQLSSKRGVLFGPGMLDGLVNFALAITRLQQEMRLNDAVLAGDASRFQDEESNLGHTNWKPFEHPDWLLLEIESNLLIRPGQVDVAHATISPASDQNSVLQMNMGQGKTSCIMPMVATAMADSKSLVRIIVPKPLLLQTAQILQSSLGGLMFRHIRHIPFSRRTPTNNDSIRLYLKIHKEMLKTGGIMLCLPEHNLSFMLSGQQRLLDSKISEATPMVNIHNWLKSVSRDILDESDYTLAGCVQLIYPSGSQMSVDGHPHRWQTIEAILSLVDQHLYGLSECFPHSIEVVRRAAGGFPLVYFLRQDVEDELLGRLTSDILRGNSNIFPIRSFDVKDRLAIKDFLSTHSPSKLRPDTLDRIRKLCPDRPQFRQTVYLLRGLLVNRILIMTLKKRWNVQYGLHPHRDPVAVPFHAKGVPSDQSEWGHPDVAILFTCLVFYYDGIGEPQLKQALTRVLKSDDPSTEYDKWVQSSRTMPDSLKAWNTINVEDDDQVHEVWKAVRYQVVVIDYFLNNFVFPRHAKQFRVKLQSSGWDIPIFSAQATSTNGSSNINSKRNQAKPLTTGFSGTNDNRTMLPLTVKQADLPSLSHTNAEVLTYLLHDRSRACELMVNQYGRRASEKDLLHRLKDMRIQVLIDAGAQILEMDNETLAKAWLSIDHSCNAALYFDSANKPWVVSRANWRRTPLLASPYADDLSKCLVYLDEAHTRGTDLKFPLDSRGALTVGQGQTKDHTVQAAMRLRQLGRSQAITFFVPMEVHQVIADLRGKSTTDKIDSHDVICWLLDNTCDGIEQLQPLYISQGMEFCRRTQAALDNPNYLTSPTERENYIAAIKQNELQTLQDMYEPKPKGGKANDFKSSNPKVAAFVKDLAVRRKGFQDTGRAVHGSALQEVEQEREVAFEVEAIRQVKKPVYYDPLTFPGLHRDIEIFARTGRPQVDSSGILPVFRLLSRTYLGSKYRVAAKSSRIESKLCVSAEFGKTVKLWTELSKDTFLRPVNWILWSEEFKAAVVLIPEEAEQIIRMMRADRTHQHVHLITYASPIELGLLAGRLYFEWDEYEALCKFLGVDDAMESDDIEQLDGPGDDDMEQQTKEGDTDKTHSQAGTGTFCPRPLAFVHEWLAVRRHGQDFIHTPMGFLTQGKPLHPNHPFFGGAASSPAEPSSLQDRRPAPYSTTSNRRRVMEEEEDIFDGVDDMGANVGDEGFEGEEKEVVYDEDSE
ncbi:hypothetical protein QBC38DRAFT_417082 [Podospora fimiseda]|uniref:ubiquitinyl hydrolase 1 n=1 Tax=Podospora fimiseda TaxID=252190 RepID=A0AAN7BPI3_9PEZI|nr:hypothetical protein QBC38DRAFT_417082 [Podospora fimiseda]